MKKKIFLLSDQAIHWNIVPTGNRKNVFKEIWGNQSTNRFLGNLSSYFAQLTEPVEWELIDVNFGMADLENIDPSDNSVNHAFAAWKQYPEGKNKCWRIQEIVHVGRSKQPSTEEIDFQQMKSADLIIFQDWGMNIRDFLIPDLMKLIKDKWVIYRAYPPIFEGNLWHEFSKGTGKKGVFITRIDDIRKLNTSISKGLSWEQTIQDVIDEIYFKRNISLHPLRTIEYIIISFGCTGTLFLHNHGELTGQAPDIHLFFDSMSAEGYWEKSHPGYLPGDLELLAGLLAKEILYLAAGDDIQFGRAIRGHLLGRRALMTRGADVSEGSLPFSVLPDELNKVYGAKPTADFWPVKIDYSLLKSILDNKGSGQPAASGWSLLGLTRWDLYSLARQIALYGPMKALKGWNIPIAKYNYLLTVDRKEIEFLHHLKTLISEYLQNRISQPLSIAVFGPPGSGKSFSIKQLAKALDLPDYEIKDITFNLSQFNENNPADLYQAFHAVRDISLSGKIPLVFWDEFDSKNLAWLRYFLAPMQDGEFQEGQLTHNIGKSIFVFAGGTCSCMEEFEEKTRPAVAEKGPDFLSRIKGYINIMGPNPVMRYCDKERREQETLDEHTRMADAKNADPEYIIRRAILINSLMQTNYRHLLQDDVLQIDDGVLNAFLLVPKFKHGTRSMETIFKTSQLFGKTKYNRSDLPPEAQMNLHVDGQQFFELVTQKPKVMDGGEAFYHLVNEISFDEKVIENMAAGIHAIYDLVFALTEERDTLSITKEEFLAHFGKMKALPEGLPHDEVSQNYHNARKMPEKLKAAGYTIVPLDVDLPAAEFDQEAFEKVSRLEHIRWVRYYIDAGWSYDPVKQKNYKLHNALVAWDEEERLNAEQIYGKSYSAKMGIAEGEILDEHYRNLDRVITLAIPWILEEAGYKMVKLPER